MNIACPECTTIYRVDPDRVPEGGVTTWCGECSTEFRVNEAMATEPGEFVTASRVEKASTTLPDGGRGAAVEETEPGARGATVGAATEPPVTEEPVAEEAAEVPVDEPTAADAPDREAAPVFGPQDPETRARRLARALVSDIKVYHPEKWEESTEAGTLRGDFRDEILKSWEEYVEQVGEEMAKKTPYFRDALNEILAQGERVF